jgi:voltage-gated potassium channel
MNPNLRIVVRTSSDEVAAKLEIAGADRTFSPHAVGGRRLDSLTTQPLIVDFLEVATRGTKEIEASSVPLLRPKIPFIPATPS